MDRTEDSPLEWEDIVSEAERHYQSQGYQGYWAACLWMADQVSKAQVELLEIHLPAYRRRLRSNLFLLDSDCRCHAVPSRDYNLHLTLEELEIELQALERQLGSSFSPARIASLLSFSRWKQTDPRLDTELPNESYTSLTDAAAVLEDTYHTILAFKEQLLLRGEHKVSQQLTSFWTG